MNRIQQTFANKKADEKLMSLFITAGFPDLESTVDLVLGFEENGADMIELGMPFSDPLADGPTIQYSSDIAIQNGITMNKIFEMVEAIREKSEIPIILMGYMNPVLHYGVEKFAQKAAEVGVDGLIIPDIPLEEDGLIKHHAEKNKLDVIHLVAPNTSDARMKLADENSQGFVYCVSVTGVTGARDGDEVSQSVARFIERVNTHVTENPVMVGFGIKSHQDAVSIAANTDGFIVGSALIDTIKNHYPQEGWQSKLFSFVHALKHGN
ncbi:tryptophan synthase subunit alpha [Gracilimonas mengyeensis]|uniref:Tryptophan synthase alpha chain n=1 Tax=Gracilimonas mengyeensis TaxID=1302730 RepID=A0A521AH61_9BACT|nr:tryptophan synthase subunit alpha [Gracilimonas mengyeensis]SMO34078.1 tryptophan synthase, alpha chain [Gracilimonas mengyeensis]